MATTVGQHSVAAFTSPVNGTTPIDANTVRGNDNTVRVAYVDHDADPGIHVQSSTIASRPAAGTAGRKWITEDSGVYTLWFDDGTNWHPVSSENVALTVLAGENLVKGDVVKVTGWNNGQDLPEVVKTTSALDTAFAVITAAVSSGSMGYATNTGIVQDVNTAAYSVGAILYANGSGGFTSTKPTSGNYQPCAYVLRSNTNNGVYYVEFSSPRIVESSANTASTIVQRDASGNFSAGTITAGALTSTGLVTFASLKGTGATTVTNILDEDNMASDSATALATQQSIKAYVDSKVATVDTLAEVLANGNTTGANDIIVNAGQKIRTPLIASQNNATAITIADTTGALTFASALADSNLATISTAGKVANSATTATSANTASAIVARDASGNFSAGTITAALTGNASTATTLQTARNINGVSFNGSADITVTAAAGTLTGNTLASGVTASSLTSVGTLTSLTVSGDLTVDTNTLSVNAANNRVGIGTTSAVWNSAEKLVVSQSVDAPVITGYSTFGAGTPVLVSWNSATSGTREHIWFADSASGGVRGKIATNGANGLQFLYGSTVGMSLDSSGNFIVDTNTLYVDAANNRVGVGTASPGYALQVDGASTAGFVTPIVAKNPSTNAASGSKIAFDGGGTVWGEIGASYNANAPYMAFFVRAGSEKMRIDDSGNLGLGVTPSAWWTNIKSLQIGGTTSLFDFGTTNSYFGNNVYIDASAANRYLKNGFATMYGQYSGKHEWLIAPNNTSGAGAALTFTTAMTLDASGNLGIGTTSPGYRLDVQGSSGFVAAAFKSSYATVGYIGSDTTTVWFGAGGSAQQNNAFVVHPGSNYLAFYTNSANERARITSDGASCLQYSSAISVEKNINASTTTGFVDATVDGQALGAEVTVVISASDGYAARVAKYFWYARRATAGNSRGITELHNESMGSVNAGVVTVPALTVTATNPSGNTERLNVSFTGGSDPSKVTVFVSAVGAQAIIRTLRAV